MSSATPWTFVEDQTALQAMLDELAELQSDKPDIFIDLEGENLSKDGRISIMQLFLFPKLRVYLLDILKLGKDTFATHNDSGVTLKQVLESGNVRKAFFDVRNDSAALYHQYEISLAGVDDIQLMELATRFKCGMYLNGLTRCIERDAALSFTQKNSWLAIKESGKKLFEPKLGGSYAVFNQRPLGEGIQRYCIQDVLVLPTLWNVYSRKLSKPWQTRVAAEACFRIVSSQSSSFNGKGKHMALVPNAWRGLKGGQMSWTRKQKPSLHTVDLNRALQIMQSLHNVSSKVHTGGPVIRESVTPIDSMTEAFQATKLDVVNLSSYDRVSNLQDQSCKQNSQSESSILAPHITKTNQVSELLSTNHGKNRMASLKSVAYDECNDQNDDDDDDDRFTRTSFEQSRDDDEQSLEGFTICSAGIVDTEDTMAFDNQWGLCISRKIASGNDL